MLPCFFYTKISEMRKNSEFKCPYEFENSVLIKFDDLKTMKYFQCPNYKFCDMKYYESVWLKTNRNVSFMANTIVNKHIDGKIEICKYDKKFPIVKHLRYNPIKSRNWFVDDDGLLSPKTKNSNFGGYKNNMSRSSNFALDNVKSLLENNKWDYFITLTFSKEFVNDRFDDKEIKYEWKRFCAFLTYWDKNIRVLCIPERHKSGCLHFHCVVGTEKEFPVQMCKEYETWNADGSSNKPISGDSKYLFPIYENGKWKKFVNGDPAFALSFFNKGRNYTAILPKGDNHDAVKNYVGKYINKSFYTGYGKRRYLATHNLLKKEKYCIYCEDEEDLNNYINEFDLKEYKKEDDIQVYRNYNIMEELKDDSEK